MRWLLAALAVVLVTAGVASSSGTVTVVRVVDGDTVDLDNGWRVRPFGLDACERGSPGGATATAAARDLVLGQRVTLREQPGIDEDRYGRKLRYVQLSDGSDFAARMVPRLDVGVYAKHSDAPPEYMAGLRAVDGPPRVCG